MKRAVYSDATTKQKTENSFVLVNGEICGSPKQHDTLIGENVKKKITRKGAHKTENDFETYNKPNRNQTGF